MLLPLLILPLITLIYSVYLKERLVIVLALALSLLNLIHAQLLVVLFDPTLFQFQFVSNWVANLIGMDGVSLMLIWLVTLLMPIVLLSLGKVKMLLLIGFWSLSTFIVLDLVLFYISFEGVLIPMFFLIGFYGGRNRKIQAAYSFFLFTLFGSLILFLALLILHLLMGSTSFIILLSSSNISKQSQHILWLAFFLSLAIKIPIMPFHLWLIEAHVESPTAGSVLLAAILLKLGSYGFIRFSLPLFPDASLYFTPFIGVFSISAVIYSSVACFSQLDLKKMIAYSSIAHMNLSLVGLFSNNFTGVASSIYFLISHGLISAGLFLLIGVLSDRLHTRTIKYLRGLVIILPTFVSILLIFTLANTAVPLTSGFIAEFYVLGGVANSNPFITFLISTAIILTPAYALLLFHRIAYGKLSRHLSSSDLTQKEYHMLFPLLTLSLILGIFPNQLFSLLHYSTLNLLFYLLILTYFVSLYCSIDY